MAGISSLRLCVNPIRDTDNNTASIEGYILCLKVASKIATEIPADAKTSNPDQVILNFAGCNLLHMGDAL